MSSFIETVKCKIEDAPGSRWGRKLVPYEENSFRWCLMKFEPGEDILIGFKKYRAKHSPAQMGYMRAVVVPSILRAIPMEVSKENLEQMYQKLKEKFGPCIIKFGKDGESGEAIVFPKSARDMNTQEMAQLIDGSINWAGEFLGITIPPPDRAMVGGQGI